MLGSFKVWTLFLEDWEDEEKLLKISLKCSLNLKPTLLSFLFLFGFIMKLTLFNDFSLIIYFFTFFLILHLLIGLIMGGDWDWTIEGLKLAVGDEIELLGMNWKLAIEVCPVPRVDSYHPRVNSKSYRVGSTTGSEK